MVKGSFLYYDRVTFRLRGSVAVITGAAGCLSDIMLTP